MDTSIQESVVTKSSADCSDRDSYSPETPEHTPIKTIRIAIHVFQKDDSSSNFQNNSQDILDVI